VPIEKTLSIVFQREYQRYLKKRRKSQILMSSCLISSLHPVGGDDKEMFKVSQRGRRFLRQNKRMHLLWLDHEADPA
jgi:hypothetical protein